ncbi:LPXTG-motif cell wall anchor domain protein (fragment) [Latilactobacillus curvatus]|uniref:LPXTG cell wall anchor domain-containing protein n=1 Tax=Latilactobacillus curvatus TaxID=28038 RepID=UPI000A1B5CAC
MPTRTLVADEKVSVKVIAQNGMNQKESPTTEITISKAVATDPLDGYTVPKPSVDPVTSADTSVTGQITLNNPPVGTTFIANVKMADGSIKKANVMPDGTSTVATGALEANSVLEVTITAQNSGYEKVSAPTTVTVSKADPLENYVVAKPSVDPIKEGDQAVTGNVTLNKPVPDGTTFEAMVTLPNGDQITATVDDQGHFTVPVAGIKEGDKLTIEVVAHNDGFDKNSDPVNVTVDKTVPTNPLEGYGVAQPVVYPVKAGDTAVTGKVTLEEPIPAGTTFEAEVTLPDGSTKTGMLNPDGTFTVDTGTLAAGDELIVHVIAHNGANQKESNPVHVIVAADTTTNPIENYTVNAPVVNPMTDGETQVTGQVNLRIPIPNGTTFTAVVTLADGTTTSAPVAADGQFTVATNTLVAETTVGVKIVATNCTFTKDSSIVYQTVSPQLDTNPLANYTVNQPTVEPVTADQTSVKGQVTLATPIPDGTKFEATVTLPNGTQKTAAVDANGNFEVVTGRLTADSDLSVKITAKNSTYTKDSENVSVTVGAATVENPLENYNVAEPVVDPVKEGDKQVTGSVTLTEPVPDGTSFEAVVTLPNGDKITATVDDQGHFTMPVDGMIKEGDELTVEVIAHNGDNEKASDPIIVTVDKPAVTNPLEDYVVAKPTIDPVKEGDKAVTGSVTFTKPIPEGTNFTAVVTLPNGIQVRVPVDENGQFAARVDGLKAGDRIIVQILAENNGYQKASVPVDILVSASDLGNPGGNGNGNNGNGSGNNGTGDGTGTGNNGSGLGNGQLGGSGNGQLGGHGPGTLKPLTISSKTLHQTNSRQGTNGQYLPQTGEKATSVWSWLGMLFLTAALFIKRLVPIKRDK